MSSNRIENYTTLAICLLACVIVLLAGDAWAQSPLPQAPTVGTTTASTSDPVGYVVGTIRFLIIIALVLIALFALVSFGSGMISELNQARQRGEWGKFSIYTGAGFLVLVIVLFAGWWGGEIITRNLT